MPRLPKPQRIQLWLDRLNRFTESQLTAAQFCQREQISLPSFYHWKRRLSPRVETPRRLPAKPSSNRTNGAPNRSNEGFTELVIRQTRCEGLRGTKFRDPILDSTIRQAGRFCNCYNTTSSQCHRLSRGPSTTPTFVQVINQGVIFQSDSFHDICIRHA